MQYYKFGNITLKILSHSFISDYDKGTLFRSAPLPNPDYFIVLQSVTSLSVPSISDTYHTANYSIWYDGKEETRVYQSNQGFYALFRKENGQYILELKNGCERYLRSERALLNHLSLEALFLNKEAFVLHSSFIKYQENGLLFFAPSGTGKSTQADLWRQYAGAEIINGDRSLIRYECAKWTAYGLPFSGTSDYCKNDSAPIKGIIYLTQASENKLENLSPATAIRKLYSEITVNSWNTKFIEKIFSLLEILVKDVPIYSFACTKSKTAVTYLKNQLFDND